MILADLIFRGLSLESILITIVILAAALGIVLIAVRAFGITIPAWVTSLLWIVLAAFMAVLAIRLVFSL